MAALCFCLSVHLSADLKSKYRERISNSLRVPKAGRVIDRFHIQKLACDAVQELRIKHRWDAIQQANEEMEEAKQNNKDYVPYRYSNGDTRRELLIRSRYLLFKSADKWTERQKQREQPSYLKNILISRKHMVCAIPCG